MKTLLAFIAAGALFAATGTSDNLVAQVIWTSSCLAIFIASCKIYERYFLTDEEKEEQV